MHNKLCSKVVVVKGEDLTQMIQRGLSYFANPSKRTVVLKPNLINAENPPTTTPSETIETLLKYYKTTGYEVIIAEGSGWSETENAYEILGYRKIAEKYEVKLVDLNKDDYEIRKSPKAFVLKSFEFLLTLKDSYIVSVPVLKEHSITTVTLSLKNMLGATLGEKARFAKKGRFHKLGVNESIVDINLYAKPNLSIIDGRTAGVGGELKAEPKKLGMMIFSEDPVAADATGATYLGYNPLKIKHIKLAQEKGLGIANPKKIDLVEVKI